MDAVREQLAVQHIMRNWGDVTWKTNKQTNLNASNGKQLNGRRIGCGVSLNSFYAFYVFPASTSTEVLITIPVSQ